MSDLNNPNVENADNVNPIKSESTTPETTPIEAVIPEDSQISETPKVEENTEETIAVETEPLKAESEHDEVLNEIEESNAEDAEDEGNKDRHSIEVKEYDSMSLEALAIELEKLV